MDALLILLAVWAVIWLLHTAINAYVKRRSGGGGGGWPPREPTPSGATPAWPPTPAQAGRATRDAAATASAANAARAAGVKPSETLNLDAGAFKPMSGDEARRAAG